MPILIFHCADRYASADALTPQELEEKVEQLLQLSGCILDAGQPVYKDDEVYYAEAQPGLQVWQLLFEDTRGLLSRDNIMLLRIAIDQSVSLAAQQRAQFSMEGELGIFADTRANALNDEEGWRSLVREFLAADPEEVTSFCRDLGIAFPRLKFSKEFPDCIGTFEGGHERYAGVLVSALAALNDNWPDWHGGDLTQALREFSVQSGFSTTLEGNGARKEDFTFSFKVDDERSENVICEPHMKLSTSDVPGDNTFHFNRIYFCPRPHDGFKGKLLVGHAGRHL
ncbi:TPA: hypothetical protein ACLEX3_002406 [Pseudomonas aeruginosa]|nr:hypothetical protein [Pseudomonas aeruginosa]